jgi:hypothetical protein
MNTREREREGGISCYDSHKAIILMLLLWLGAPVVEIYYIHRVLACAFYIYTYINVVHMEIL